MTERYHGKPPEQRDQWSKDGGKMSRSREIPTRDGKVTGSLSQLMAIGPRLPVTYTSHLKTKSP